MSVISRIKTVGLFFFLTIPFSVVCLGQTPETGNKALAHSSPFSWPEAEDITNVDKPLSLLEMSKDFIDKLAEKHHIDKTWITGLFDQAEINSTAIRLMAPAPSGKKNRNWQEYRQKMIEPSRIAAGVRFRNRYQKYLDLAEQQFGVPSHVIVGILGIESVYGRNTGNFRTFDTLATLAFEYPDSPNQIARKAYFRQELENFLLYARETGTDPMNFYGSYAGAIGSPQFMPSSIRRYAVDFDGDGKIDLENSAIDAIGSVANFLSQQGWKEKIPIVFPVKPVPDCVIPAIYLNQGLTAKFTLDQLNAACLASDVSIPNDLHFGVIDLPNGVFPAEFWIGTDNFFAITRYNRSYFYAMSVVLLGQEIYKEKQTINIE